MVGLSLAVVGALSVAISGGLVPFLIPRLGERRTLCTGQFFGGLGMLLAGLARTGTSFMASIPVMMLWTISGPAAQGMMTYRVSEREQGALQGAIASLRSVAVLFGPALFTFTFAFFIDPKHSWHLPAAPWFLAGALLFAAMTLAMRAEPSVVARPVASPDVVPPAGVTSGTMVPEEDASGV